MQSSRDHLLISKFSSYYRITDIPDDIINKIIQ